MNLGQSILAIAALVIITFLIVSANRVVNQSLQDELKGEAYNQAGEIANDLMNEAMKKKFDDPTVIHTVTNQYVWIQGYGWKYYWSYTYKLYDFYQPYTDFTAPSLLGPSGMEKTSVPHPDRYPYKSLTGYDDFDDYNGYQRIVDTPMMTGFVVNCAVAYVDTANLMTPVTSKQTYCKRLVVKVSHSIYLPDTLMFSTIMSY